MAKYNPQKIEKKWQSAWLKSGIYWAKDGSKKKKSYILVEFPYPSGDGLHVGHCRPYIAFDVLARKRRMEGFNVLFPMGWDAFGLPTENYAIKTGVHPRIATRKNTSFFKRQQQSMGLSFDWSREINTTDPEYYKWTQWIFLQLFKNGLAYKKKLPINWCPSCKIGLAQEEVVEGNCERCGAKVVKKEKEQWLLKITEYADRLIEDLALVDYPEKVRTLQRDWIGRSEGREIKFKVRGLKLKVEISVFTTRVDTLFGCTYLVVAPEHPIIEELKSEIFNLKSIQRYIEQAKAKTERERIAETKNKTGIELRGVTAVNPANSREIPIYVADYVVYHYGTGAIMAVPAHDARDWDFAKKHNLPVIEVIKPPQDTRYKIQDTSGAYEGEGILINSGRFTGMRSQDAKQRIGEWLQKRELSQRAVYYKLRDWVFSRQRYWGEPTPLIFCESCKKLAESSNLKVSNSKFQNSKQKFNTGELLNPGWIAVPEKDLPVELPNVKDYKPTEEGESPLAKVKNWVNVVCPQCGGAARRETDVMPNWAGSNWYYLAYIMRGSSKFDLRNSKLFKYWMPVDWYNGGMEHSTLHLLYSRFIYKFLWDIGAVPKVLGPEPYKKRTSHGVILGPGGQKMSKSRGNVITPDAVIKQYGADTLRVYEMFMGPFGDTIAWDTKGVHGARRFLRKVWELFQQTKFRNSRFKIDSKFKIQNLKLTTLLHKTIRKVGEDIENLRFNTAISALMILVNEMSASQERLTEKNLKILLLLLAPFAPHIAEELWQELGYKTSVHIQRWPKYSAGLIKEETFTLVIQVNGKVRDKIAVKASIAEQEAKELAIASEKIKKWIDGKEIKKAVFVPGKLVNIVTQ